MSSGNQCANQHGWVYKNILELSFCQSKYLLRVVGCFRALFIPPCCSVVRKKAAEGNLNLCPSAWGQLHPYGLLEPTWCEVSRSDASLAAGLQSKGRCHHHKSRLGGIWDHKLLYILNNEISQAESKTASGCLVKRKKKLFWIALFNGALKKKSVTDLATI